MGLGIPGAASLSKDLRRTRYGKWEEGEQAREVRAEQKAKWPSGGVMATPEMSACYRSLKHVLVLSTWQEKTVFETLEDTNSAAQ